MEKNQGQQMRITDKDIYFIKSAFAENDELLKTIRKVFLPELDDDVPIGQQVDFYKDVAIDNLPLEEAMINIKARRFTVQHIEFCLMQLKVLAGNKDETIEQTKERLKKDSAK